MTRRRKGWVGPAKMQSVTEREKREVLGRHSRWIRCWCATVAWGFVLAMGAGVQAQEDRDAVVRRLATAIADMQWGERERTVGKGEVYEWTPGPEQAWADAPYVVQRLRTSDGATILMAGDGDSERVLVIGELFANGTTTVKFDRHTLQGRQEVWLLDGGRNVSGTLLIDGSGRDGLDAPRGTDGPLMPGLPGGAGMTISVNLVLEADVVDKVLDGGSLLAKGRLRVVSKGGTGGEGEVGWEFVGSGGGGFRYRTQGPGGNGGGGGKVELRLHMDAGGRAGGPAFYEEREVSSDDWATQYSERFGVDIDVTAGAGGVPTKTRGRRGEKGQAGAPGRIVWAMGRSTAHDDEIENFRRIMEARDAAAGGVGSVGSVGSGDVNRYLGLDRHARGIVHGLFAERSEAIRNILMQLDIGSAAGSQQTGPPFAQPMVVVPGSDVCDAAAHSLRELEHLTEDLQAEIDTRMEAILLTGPRARSGAGGAGATSGADIRTREQWERFLSEQGELYLSARRSIGNLVTRCGAQVPR